MVTIPTLEGLHRKLGHLEIYPRFQEKFLRTPPTLVQVNYFGKRVLSFFALL